MSVSDVDEPVVFPSDPSGTGPEEDTPQPEYDGLVNWVEQWLAPTIRRNVRGNVKWCPRWWAHPEAAARLGALWAAWELANFEGGASMSQWWLYHFESHWEALTETRGPFAQCSSKACIQADALPCAPFTLR